MHDERNRQIQEDWLSGFSSSQLQAKYGLSKKSIHDITRPVTSPERRWRRGPKALADRRPISQLHAQIGHDVANHRHAVLGLGRVEFGRQLGLSSIKVAELENGLLELPLSLLTRLASVMGTTVVELIRPRGGSSHVPGHG